MRQKKILKTMLPIIWFGHLMSIGVLGFVLIFIMDKKYIGNFSFINETMFTPLVVVALVSMILSFLLPRFLWKVSGPFESEEEREEARYLEGVIKIALCESIGVLGFVLSLTSQDDSFDAFLYFGSVAVGLLIYHYPRK